MGESQPMQTPHPMYQPLHAILAASQDLLVAAARAYREALPDDARAWATLLAAGRVVPAVHIELLPEGPKIMLGYQELGGLFHKFFELPDPRLARERKPN